MVNVSQVCLATMMELENAKTVAGEVTEPILHRPEELMKAAV